MRILVKYVNGLAAVSNIIMCDSLHMCISHCFIVINNLNVIETKCLKYIYYFTSLFFVNFLTFKSHAYTSKTKPFMLEEDADKIYFFMELAPGLNLNRIKLSVVIKR